MSRTAWWGMLGLGAALIGGAIGWHLYDRWRPRREHRGPHPYSRGWAD